MKKIRDKFARFGERVDSLSKGTRYIIMGFLFILTAMVASVTLNTDKAETGAGKQAKETTVISYTDALTPKALATVKKASFIANGDSYDVLLTTKTDKLELVTVPVFQYQKFFDTLEARKVTIRVDAPSHYATVQSSSTDNAKSGVPARGGAYLPTVNALDTGDKVPAVKNTAVSDKNGRAFINSLLVTGLFLLGAFYVFAGFIIKGAEKREAYQNNQLSFGAGGDPNGILNGLTAKKKAQSSHFVSEAPTVTFADVAGCEEAVEDLREMVEYLHDPERFVKLGAKPPKGVLLCGPPGTGKTLLAKAVAGEANVPFFAAAGSDFIEMFVGVGAKRIRELFTAAKAHEKAVIFIDEIDAFARSRMGANAGSNSQESENTMLALLDQLDGFKDRGNIILIAATNRPDVLDPAILRAGRLDRRVEIPNPDRRGREQILKVHARNKPLAEDIDFEHLAKRTPGFSGAQLEAIVNEAAMIGARNDLDQITMACFDDAIATVAMGRARGSALVTESDRTLTAWHETGHALAAFLLPEADDPVQVSIVPRGPAGGVTWMGASEDIFLSRGKAHAQLVVAMAGRAGEEFYLNGEFTSGASGDIQAATETAKRMAAFYGMTRLGLQQRDPNSKEVQEVVQELLEEALDRARALVSENSEFFSAMVETLLAEENLTHRQIVELFHTNEVTLPEKVAALPRLPQRLIEEAKSQREFTKAATYVYQPSLASSRSAAMSRHLLRRKRNNRPTYGL